MQKAGIRSRLRQNEDLFGTVCAGQLEAKAVNAQEGKRQLVAEFFDKQLALFHKDLDIETFRLAPTPFFSASSAASVASRALKSVFRVVWQIAVPGNVPASNTKIMTFRNRGLVIGGSIGFHHIQG